MGLDFHWTVTLGDVCVVIGGMVVAGSFLFGAGGGVQRLQMLVSAAMEQVTELKKEVKEMSKVLTELAVQRTELISQKEQISMLLKWYDELRRGVGRINGNGH